MAGKAKKFYAYYVVDLNQKGIFTSWDECKNFISGKKNIRYKSFSSEADAESWLASGAKYDPNPELREKKILKAKMNDSARKKLGEGIYFDSGTGRGIGVEVRVTDVTGISYLPEFFPKLVNEFENIPLGKDVTNNYGELIGLYCALKIAASKNIKNIYGDSNLVINFWSKGRANYGNLNGKTIKYIELVTQIRRAFEEAGGHVEFVSGDINPADLGFHKS